MTIEVSNKTVTGKHDIPAPALARGLAVMELLEEACEMSFKNLQTRTGYNVSSLNRLLKTLLATGYINKNAYGNYELGLKAFLLSQGNSFWKKLTEQAEPELKDLSETFEITACLLGYLDDSITVIAKHAHQDNVMLRQVGEAKPDFLLSPWGYLYIAELPEECRPAFFNWARSAGTDALRKPTDEELEKLVCFVKENHYADDKGQILRRGIRRLAAPVYGPDGHLIAAVGLGTFAGQITEEDVADMANILIAKAQKLTKVLQGE